jgi:hypothetical protein
MIFRNFFRHVFIGLAALLAALPQPATAQVGVGRSGFSTVQSMNAREYWDAVFWFGRCFARTSQPIALDLLASEPLSREEQAIFARVFNGQESNCLNAVLQLSMAQPHIRGAIAEGFIRDGPPPPARLLVTAPPAGVTIHNITEAARCYTATHAAEVRALIMETRPASSQELAAIQRMGPDFLQCVPPEARGYRFNTTDLRYRLAEALLRLGLAGTPAQPQPAASQPAR